ncbi:MAG: PIN domain nuclease [Candidatus Acidiferrum sp.]
MVIVDTTVWVDYLRGKQNPQVDWLYREMDRQRLGLTDLILCEVLQGVREEATFASVLKELGQFEIFETGSVDLAVAAAQNFRKLRQRGLTVRKTIDCLIATFCLREKHVLLHRDRDYEAFEQELGLKAVEL